MNLTWVPNALTIARCVLAVGVAGLILTQPKTSLVPAAAFILVALTDFLDGWAARRLQAVSAFGAFLDPIADKLLVGFSLLALAYLQSWAWAVLIPTLAIVGRDIIATAIRLFPSIQMPVSQLAKWKTALEMLGIVALLLAGPLAIGAVWTLGLAIIWLAAGLSIYTLGLYLGALIADSKRPHS